MFEPIYVVGMGTVVLGPGLARLLDAHPKFERHRRRIEFTSSITWGVIAGLTAYGTAFRQESIGTSSMAFGAVICVCFYAFTRLTRRRE